MFNIKNENTVLEYLTFAANRHPIAMSDQTKDLLQGLEQDGFITIERLYPSAIVRLTQKGREFWVEYHNMRAL